MSEWISKSVSELVTKSPIELSWKIITCVCQASGLCVQEALAGNVDDTDNQENPHRLQLKRSLFVFTTYQCHILQLTAHHEAPGSEQSTPPSWRELHRPQQNASSKIWISSWVLNTKKSNTEWSKETVDWNFLPTDSKIPKSVITQWILESIYREVMVFWCFNSVRCVEFCLFKHFQYRAFSAPYKAWTLQNTLIHIQTP